MINNAAFLHASLLSVLALLTYSCRCEAFRIIRVTAPRCFVLSTVSAASVAVLGSNETGTSSTRPMMVQDSSRPQQQEQKLQNVITTITSIHEFISFVNQDKDRPEKQLCVVKYHATWCKICRLVAVKYKKFAFDYNNAGGQQGGSVSTTPLVRFADVEVSANSQLCKTLGISVFPFIEIYEGGIKVAAFSTGASYKFNSIVGSSIKEKLAMSNDDKLVFQARYRKEITETSKVFNSLDDLN